MTKSQLRIYWDFYHQKNKNFQTKDSGSFHICDQYIDRGYSLEPPQHCLLIYHYGTLGTNGLNLFEDKKRKRLVLDNNTIRLSST